MVQFKYLVRGQPAVVVVDVSDQFAGVHAVVELDVDAGLLHHVVPLDGFQSLA